MQRQAKLAYIVSVGHSGSTLLDIITGSIPSTFSTGELTYLPWQIFRSDNTHNEVTPQMSCSCGSRFYECNVWKSIIDSLSKVKGFDISKHPFKFKINLLQNERYVENRLSWARVQRMLFGLAAQTKGGAPIIKLWGAALHKSIDNNWLLFDAISTTCEVEYVVDSSKNAYRLRLLHSRRPENVRVLVLIRDVRGVAHSAQKLKMDPVIAARGWLKQYQRIFRTLENMKDVQCMLVRYEDLAADPVKERSRIATFLGLSKPASELDIDTRKMHLVAGNAMRHCGRLRVNFSEKWRDELALDTQRRIEKIGRQLAIPQLGVMNKV